MFATRATRTSRSMFSWSPAHRLLLSIGSAHVLNSRAGFCFLSPPSQYRKFPHLTCFLYVLQESRNRTVHHPNTSSTLANCMLTILALAICIRELQSHFPPATSSKSIAKLGAAQAPRQRCRDGVPRAAAAQEQGPQAHATSHRAARQADQRCVSFGGARARHCFFSAEKLIFSGMSRRPQRQARVARGRRTCHP